MIADDLHMVADDLQMIADDLQMLCRLADLVVNEQ